MLNKIRNNSRRHIHTRKAIKFINDIFGKPTLWKRNKRVMYDGLKYERRIIFIKLTSRILNEGKTLAKRKF